MKIIFVQSENESLAVEQLTSLLKREGHEVRLAYDNRYFARTAVQVPSLARLYDARDLIARRVAAFEPDLVAFSVMTSSYEWAVDMAARIKRACDAPVIFGGVHAVAVPEVVIEEECVDMVCCGEGEKPLLELARAIDGDRDMETPGIWVKSDGRVRRSEPAEMVEDLDSLPFPDKELFYRRLPWLSRGYLMMSSRGCPYACTFCSNDMLRRVYRGRTKYVRRRSVENVLDEMEYASRTYRPDRFNILDDCFTADRAWLAEWAEGYRRRVGLPFVAVSHPQLVNEETARLLASANCAQLLLGVQSASEEIRRNILNRRESNAQVRAAAAACHRHGVKFSIDHIFGTPFEGAGEYRKALEFYNELRPDAINTYYLVYFPRTSIIEKAMEAGILDEADVEGINRGRLDLSMNLGLGSGDRKKTNLYFNYAFLLSLVPLLPGRAIEWIVRRRLYLDRWKPSIAITLALRVLSVLKMGARLYWRESAEILAGFLKATAAALKRKVARG